ncbi:superoxide dismutase [Cu-Zn]-like [Convolutriloba macropyga]|uniref:superoxide dismutase [Cu-Zn]-like n=1 Tax=Convolutriloba macropyga TaxID=536237 RepID=UPI003F529014
MLSATFLIACVSIEFVVSCTSRNDATPDSAFTDWAVCVFQDNLDGAVFMREGSTGLEYRVRIRGLESGLHGFHVHQYGSLYQADSSSGRCKAAGGHYNPLSQSHGAINDSTRHVGDLGNICADSKGEAIDVFTDTMGSLLTGANPINGYAIVVHEDADDFTSQPTGNAGGRVGCCIVGITSEWTLADVDFGYLETSSANLKALADNIALILPLAVIKWITS